MKSKLIVILFPFLLLSLSGLSFGMSPDDLLLKAFQDKSINSSILTYLSRGASFDSLITAGIDINTVDASKGDTLLHIIVVNGKINVLNNLLTSFSPNPNIENMNGVKAICLARSIIDSNEKKAKELEEAIQLLREDNQKLINGIETFSQKKDPNNIAFHKTSNKLKKEFITKFDIALKKNNDLLQRHQRAIRAFTYIHDQLLRYSGYYEVGILEKFTLKESAHQKFFRTNMPQIKGLFCIISFSSVVVGLTSLVNVIFKRNATSRLSAIKNHLLKVKKSLLNIDFDIHNTEFILTPVDELFNVEDITKDADQHATLSAALNRFDELVFALYERIKESYLYHPASYLVERESVLVNELEQAHLDIATILDECLVGKNIKKSMLTLFGSAFVGAGSWWCYKHMHPLKKLGLF